MSAEKRSIQLTFARSLWKVGWVNHLALEEPQASGEQDRDGGADAEAVLMSAENAVKSSL